MKWPRKKEILEEGPWARGGGWESRPSGMARVWDSDGEMEAVSDGKGQPILRTETTNVQQGVIFRNVWVADLQDLQTFVLEALLWTHIQSPFSRPQLSARSLLSLELPWLCLGPPSPTKSLALRDSVTAAFLRIPPFRGSSGRYWCSYPDLLRSLFLLDLFCAPPPPHSFLVLLILIDSIWSSLEICF